ncbi:MAG: transporter substrate-binding domain-containing protein [Candidatus Babeliaceae bacterium]|jgi:ABC-type amino acid transport substrate-binding protein
MKLKIILALVSALVIGCGMYLFFTRVSQPNPKNILTIGVASGYAPFISINTHNEYEGFDIDVAHALAQKMGKKLELLDLGSMTALFMALNQGSIDAIMWGLSITQERLKRVAMVRYQGELVTSYPLLFWGAIPGAIKSIEDMKGLTVCVEPGSSQEAVLAKYYINVLPTERIDDALLNIQYGKAAAAFVEPAIAKKFKNKYPEIVTLDVPLAPEDQVEGIGIAILPENKDVINQVERAIVALQQDGTLKKYEEKWGIA